MGETVKAFARRTKEGFFEKYIKDQMNGIDLGCQNDPLMEHFRKWDVIFGDGDATYMEGVNDNTYSTVYASHILEHLDEPETALQNWHRITKPGGFLIVLVPHRDLYEKKSQPPSSWNHEHKYFYLPDRDEPPGVFSLKGMIERALPEAKVVSFRVLDDGWVSLPSDVHSGGEYSIEVIIEK